MADAHNPNVDDLDRTVGEGMAVFALVRLVEARPDFFKFLLADVAGGKRYFQFVALADIAQIAIAHERHGGGLQMISRELPRSSRSMAAISALSRSISTRPLTWNWVRIASYLRSVVSSPMAEVMPG